MSGTFERANLAGAINQLSEDGVETRSMYQNRKQRRHSECSHDENNLLHRRRKIAAITLTLWKKGGRFDAELLKSQAA
jgi:hypothetical protein